MKNSVLFLAVIILLTYARSGAVSSTESEYGEPPGDPASLSTAGGGVRTCDGDTEDLRKRIEALELLVSGQVNRHGGRKRLEEVIRVIEKGVIQSVEFVKTRIERGTPATDEECSFDYIMGRCTPVCDCNLQPKIGDYSLGRACRFVDKLANGTKGVELVPPCDPEDFDNTPWVLRLSLRIVHTVKKAMVHIKEHAPPTDAECAFEWLKFSCSKGCEFSYQYGDYSLNRVCRLKVTIDESDNVVDTSEMLVMSTDEVRDPTRATNMANEELAPSTEKKMQEKTEQPIKLKTRQ